MEREEIVKALTAIANCNGECTSCPANQFREVGLGYCNDGTALTAADLIEQQAVRIAELEKSLNLAICDMKTIAKMSHRSNCTFCNKEKCVGCYVEREFEWRGVKSTLMQKE